MKRLRGRLGLKGFECVDSNGLSGDLALYWHENCLVDILDRDERYIYIALRMQADAPQ